MRWKVTALEKMSEGGLAEVYLGVRTDNGDQVVVKFLRDYGIPDNVRWFRREIRILQLVQHERLVPILAAHPDAPQPYYVMPYFPNGSLLQWAGRLSHAQLRAVGVQICEAVAALHARDIAHGDLKPQNILVAADGNLRTGDPLGNGAGCTVVVGGKRGGTPGYWAPEIAAGGDISKSGDMFSIGATLYHLATGVAPEDGAALDPWAVGAAVPRDIRDLILTLTTKSPDRIPISDAREILAQRTSLVAVLKAIEDKRDRDALLKAGAVVGGIALLLKVLSKK